MLCALAAQSTCRCVTKLSTTPDRRIETVREDPNMSSITGGEHVATPSTPTPTDSPSRPAGPTVWSTLWRCAPAVAVVGVLAGLAIWGHSTGWTLPKFSALIGYDAGEDADWCESHSVPGSLCVECNASLLPPGKDYGWCQEHGIAGCPLHHPEVAQLKATPTISAAEMERARRALAASALRREQQPLRTASAANSICLGRRAREGGRGHLRGARAACRRSGDCQR